MENNLLFDKMWGIDGIHPFGNPLKFEDYMDERKEQLEELEIEVCEFIKGDFKTVIVCKFNKLGYMISHVVYHENLSDTQSIMTDMKNQLFSALEEERYEDAKNIQEQINKFRYMQEYTNKQTL